MFVTVPGWTKTFYCEFYTEVLAGVCVEQKAKRESEEYPLRAALQMVGCSGKCTRRFRLFGEWTYTDVKCEGSASIVVAGTLEKIGMMDCKELRTELWPRPPIPPPVFVPGPIDPISGDITVPFDVQPIEVG
jgi:hypothetical protein